ncbi:MAG: putative pterin-4-alpha-carbinolamine dehydratase [Chlamydiia bacterium]|nr:putative pterin-4-alpha-carbinolamine dehydratase [Chlamydiia bacterium]
MEEWAKKSCTDLTIHQALSQDEIEAFKGRLPDLWEIREGMLVREFEFPNFRKAFKFASHIATLADEENHHPTLEIRWGKVKVALSSDDVGGLTEKDFILASKIEVLNLEFN